MENGEKHAQLRWDADKDRWVARLWLTGGDTFDDEKTAVHQEERSAKEEISQQFGIPLQNIEVVRPD